MLGRVWGFGTFPSLIPVCRARQAEHGPPQRRGRRLLGVKGPGAGVRRHGDSAGPDGARSPGKEKRRSPAQRPGAGPSQTSRQVLALPPGVHGRTGWEVAGHPAWASMGRRVSAERAAASLSQSDLHDDVGTGPARRGTGSDRPRLCQSHTPAARGRSPPLGVLGPHPRLAPEGQGPRPAPNCDDHPHDHRDCLCMSPLALRVVTAQDRQDPGAPAEPFPVGPGLPSALRPRARS